MAQELEQLIYDLCAIPAPSWHEEKRAEFVLNKLVSWGITDAYIDEALNVVWPYRATEKGNFAIAAHLDTVFPDTESFSVRIEGGRAYCPGIGDDTANVAVLMLEMKRFAEKRPETKKGIIFVLNTGEEGLGNLKGVRQLFRDFEGRIDSFVSLDGGPDALCTGAVGSRRYRVTIATEGGHSYGAFGNRNAIEKAAKLIEEIYAIKVPVKPGTRTTYNVGTISGGTSVNTIAEKVELLCEYRSDDVECLDIMEQKFRAIFDETAKDCVSFSACLVGDRPCARNVDRNEMESLTRGIEEAAGKTLPQSSGSTDCNWPLSLGIAAACWGACRCRGAHTYGECINLETLESDRAPVGKYLDSFIVKN